MPELCGVGRKKSQVSGSEIIKGLGVGAELLSDAKVIEGKIERETLLVLKPPIS